MKVAHHGSADDGLPALLERAAARDRGDRGRRAQHLRPPDAVHARGAAVGAARLPHGPRRHRAAAGRGGAIGDRSGAVTATRLDSATVPTFKAAYLIHGDDHGRIAERRARLRAMAEAESGAERRRGVRGRRLHARGGRRRAAAMTFAIGRRFVIADGVERWKDAEVGRSPRRCTAWTRRRSPSPSSPARRAATRCPRRWSRPSRRPAADRGRGRRKPRELPHWLVEQANELGIELDDQAARALVAQVGERQQRLVRELEKLALEHGPGARIGVEEVQASCAELRRAQGLDARRRARRRRCQGRHARAARAAPAGRAPAEPDATRWSAGSATRCDRRGAGGGAAAGPDPPDAADAVVRRRPPDLRRLVARCGVFRRALELLADLEVESRGGAAVR